MSLSPRERKVLWALSGNMCAFPGCELELVQQLDDQPAKTVLGMEAHIAPRSPVGPRGDGTSGAELAANYLLLCPNHHRVVDERPDIYTLAALAAMKADHEGRVRARMAERSTASLAEAALLRAMCGRYRPVNAWRSGTFGLVVCSFGSEPVPQPADRWFGSGLVFTAFSPSHTETLYVSGEGDPAVLYSVRGTTLTVVQHSYDPRIDDHAPFVEHAFAFDRSPAGVSRRLLMSPSADTDRDLTEALAVLALPSEGGSASHEIALFRVRNAGLADREGSSRVLALAAEYPWCDGAVAEALSSIRRELELAFEIQDAG